MTDLEFEGPLSSHHRRGAGVWQGLWPHASERTRGARLLVASMPRLAKRPQRSIRKGGGEAISPATYQVKTRLRRSGVPMIVVADLGGLGILIRTKYCTRPEDTDSRWETLGLKRIRRLFDVNVIGAIIPARWQRTRRSAGPGPGPPDLSSSAAYPAGNAYGVSKLAVRALTMALACELAPDGIRVNAVGTRLDAYRDHPDRRWDLR